MNQIVSLTIPQVIGTFHHMFDMLAIFRKKDQPENISGYNPPSTYIYRDYYYDAGETFAGVTGKEIEKNIFNA